MPHSGEVHRHTLDSSVDQAFGEKEIPSFPFLFFGGFSSNTKFDTRMRSHKDRNKV